MQKRLNMLRRMPAWLSVLIALSLVAVIGYVDYLTDDYSLLIFYAIPIALAALSLGNWGAIILTVSAGCARYISDYNSYTTSNFRYKNFIEDMLFLLIIGLVMSAVKRLLDEEKREGRH
jgi:hypothetical protein